MNILEIHMRNKKKNIKKSCEDHEHHEILINPQENNENHKNI